MCASTRPRLCGGMSALPTAKWPRQFLWCSWCRRTIPSEKVKLATAQDGAAVVARPGSHRGFTLLELLIVLFIIGITLSFAMINITTSEQQEVEDEADRLMALIRIARENAILDAEDLAVAFTDKGYRFEKYDGAEWQPLDDTTLRFRPFPQDLKVEYKLQGKPAQLLVRIPSLPDDEPAESDEEGDAIDLSDLKGTSIVELRERKSKEKEQDKKRSKQDRQDEDSDNNAKDKKDKKNKKDEPEPIRIFFLSNGEVTPFEVFFRKADHESGYRLTGNAVGELEVTAVIKEVTS